MSGMDYKSGYNWAESFRIPDFVGDHVIQKAENIWNNGRGKAIWEMGVIG